ncbi:MAG: amidohydrolase family protein [bacterium]|nr:amidohydrolase family protein [bacterium]
MRTILKGGVVVNLDGGPSTQQDLVIEGEQIASVGGAAAANGDKVVDVSGMYLLPGLVNCHVHLGWDGSHDLQMQANESPAINALKAIMNIHRHLSAGVTTIRDLGMNEANIDAKIAVDNGWAPWIRLFPNGRAICTTGGHTWWCCREADGIYGVRKAVREQFKAGASWIKIMGSHEEVQFTMDELRAMVEEAHQNGMMVTAHATFNEAISRVVDAGVDCVEHGGSMTPETIDKLVEKGVPIVTTFSPRVQQVKFGLDFGMSVFDVERRKDQMAEKSRFAGNVAAARAGVPIVFGTDAGSPVVPHYAIAEELKFMVDIGVCPDNLDALNSITRRGIKLLGLEDELGSLEAGRTADVVAVGGDPLASLDHMKDVKRVFVRGQMAFSSEGGYTQVGRDVEGLGTRWGPGAEIGYRRA